MSIINILGSKNEQHNLIGKVEADSSEVINILLGLVQSVGMANPKVKVNNSKKGVTITKVDDKYTLTLQMFEPPIEVSWSSPIEYAKVLDFLNNIAKDSKKIGWINIFSLSDGTKFLQFATN